MKHWITGSSLLMLAALLATSLLLACAGPEEEGVYEVRISSQMPVGHHVTEAVDLFCERAEELSEGRLDFHHFPASQLMQDIEVPEAISTGTIEMAETQTAMWMGMIPDIIPPYSVVHYDDLDHAMRVWHGPVFDYVGQKFEEDGNTKLLGTLLYGINFGYLLTTPVTELGGAEGMKIRIYTATLAAEVTSIGGTPVLMSSADVYMALQQGTIDGASSGLTSFYSRKWYEVAKYCLVIDYPTPLPFHLVANLDWWNSLPADLQQAIEDAAEEADEYCVDLCVANEDTGIAGLEQEGVEIYWVPEEEQDEWLSVIRAATRAVAVKELGEELVAQYEAWVEEAREE